MANVHGIFVDESATALSAPQETSAGVLVIVGTAPVNMAKDPSAVVNTPVLANSAEEAMEALGYLPDFGNYSLCQSMFVGANLYPTKPAVYINVLDPATHKTTLSAQTVSVSEMQATVPVTGIIKDNLSVSIPASGGGSATSLTQGTDYTLSFDGAGYLVITLIAGGAGAAAQTLSVSGYKLNPSAVTKTDIIGTVNASTGEESGAECIRQIAPKFGIIPGIIIAPGWSQEPEVGAALCAKAATINGVYKAVAFLDLPTGASGARKYTDCKTVKETCGYTSKYSYVLWPCVKVGTSILAYSAVAAARAAYLDTENEDVPYASPSNKTLAISGTCLADGTEVNLDQDQATTVNEYGVATAVNINGFRIWGNYTGAYPSSSDAKDIWLAVRRMFNWQGNNFIQTYFSRVDDPMNFRLIEDIVTSENIRLSAYVPEYIAGAKIEYRKEDNPATSILAGRIKFRQHFAPYTPAQTIENILDYDIAALQAALTGGEEDGKYWKYGSGALQQL